MHQPPFAILKSKDVRNPVRPLCRPIHVGHARIEGLDIGGVGQLRCHHGRDIFITDSAALELLASPIPAPRHSVPALLISAPAIETTGVVGLRIKG
jgi:hypothetical protein